MSIMQVRKKGRSPRIDRWGLTFIPRRIQVMEWGAQFTGMNSQMTIYHRGSTPLLSIPSLKRGRQPSNKVSSQLLSSSSFLLGGSRRVDDCVLWGWWCGGFVILCLWVGVVFCVSHAGLRRVTTKRKSLRKIYARGINIGIFSESH